MCRMILVGACLRLMVVVAALALSLFVPEALVGMAMWPIVWLMWERVPPDARLSPPSLLELLPFAIAAQVALDCLVPFLGDGVVLVANALIVRVLRRPRLPRAHVEPRRCRRSSGRAI